MFRDLPRYADTKPSGFWNTPIPAGWREVPGFAVARENRRKNRDLAETQVLSLSYGRIVAKPVEKQHGLVPDSYEGYQVLEPGDIVVRPTDLQNDQRSIRVGMVHNRGIITSAYIGLRAQGDWESAYAYLYMSVVDSTKRIYGMGRGLRQQLSWADIKRMPCLVPPPEEQAAIVKYLAHANARINKAIAAKRRLIALLEEEKKAIADVILGQLDEGAREVRHVLSQLVDCEHKTAPFVEGEPYWVLRTSSVKSGEIVWSGAYTTDAASYEVWTNRAVPEAGDVIFTREAPVGEAAVIPDGRRVALGQRTVLMKVRREIMDPQFLVYQVYAGLPRRRISLATQGSTVGHFNMDDIGWMRVAVPDIEVQRQLVSKIENANSGANEVIDKMQSEIALLQEFRTRLAADVVTGQVDVRAIAATMPDAPEAAVEALGEDVPMLDEELGDTVEGDDE